MIKLTFVTHSTSEDNEAGLASGHHDPALSALGRRQAAELGEREAAELFNAVYCSDLRRARDTAAIAFAGREIPILPDVRLRECDYGDLTRHAATEIEAMRSQCVTAPFPGGESYTDCVRRTEAFLAYLRGQHSDARILIVAHRATHYALDHLLGGVPLEQAVTAPWHWQPDWAYQIAP